MTSDEKLNKLLSELIQRIRLLAADADAQQRATLEILQLVADRAGAPEIQGKPIREFYRERKAAYLDEKILSIGDRDPASAESLQAMMEHLKRTLGL